MWPWVVIEPFQSGDTAQLVLSMSGGPEVCDLGTA